MKTLVLGLGNPTLTDDAVGLAVARGVRETVDNEHVAVREATVGGLSLLHLAEGYDRVIIIDAFENGAGRPGQIHRLSPDDVHWSLRPAWTPGVPFATALELARRLGMHIPTDVVILAIEAADVETFGDELTPSVAAAVPRVVELVLQELVRQSHDARGLPLDCTLDTLLQYVTKPLRGIQRLLGRKPLQGVRLLDFLNTPPSISTKG